MTRFGIKYCFASVLFLLGTAALGAADRYLIVKGIVGINYYKYPGQARQRLRYTGMKLKKGVKVMTGPHSRLKLGFSDDSGSEVILRGRTTVRVETLLAGASRKTLFFLPTGRMKAVVSTMMGNDFKVRTKSAVAGVRGTSFGVEAQEGARSVVYVFKGKVAVKGLGSDSSPGESRELQAGKKIAVKADGAFAVPEQVTRSDARKFEATFRDYVARTDDDTSKKTAVDRKQPPASMPGSRRTAYTVPIKPGWGGSLGPEMIGGKAWTKLVITPTLVFGNFAIGLYIPIYYDAQSPIYDTSRWYNSGEWDFINWGDALRDIFDKIRFMQYGTPAQPVYVRMGTLEDSVLGNGFLMNHYNNNLNFPDVKRLGLDFQFTFGFGGIEGMIGDINRGRIYATRLFLTPFPGDLKRLAFGYSLVMDAAANGDWGNRPIVFATGADVSYQIIPDGPFQSRLFLDYGRQGFGISGTYYGMGHRDLKLNSSYGWTFGLRGQLTVFTFQAAYRYLAGGFIPEYFDSRYEVDAEARALALVAGTGEDFNGWIVEMGADFGTAAVIKLNFQEYYGTVAGINTVNNKLYFLARLNKGVVPSFHASFEYERNHLTAANLFKDFFGNGVITTTRISYEISPGIDLTTVYRRFYESDGSYTENYGVETQMGF